MTPVDKDDFEDADLARRLAALPQPEPSAELDAAIFAQVQQDLAPRPAAANDPASEAQQPKRKHRYRAPLAFAASLAGIAILFPVWRAYQHQEQHPVEVRIVPEEMPALPAPMVSSDEVPAPADKKRESAIVSAKPAPPVPQLEMPMHAPEPAAAAAPPPPPVPAPEPAAAPPARAMAADELDSPRKAAARSQETENPKERLQEIERLLDAGDTDSAAAQWKRFRKAHPDYPVPDTLAGRLKALE